MTDIAVATLPADATARSPHIVRAFAYAALLAISFVMLYPLLWMVSSSFKPENEIFSTTSLIPETFTADAYRRGWNGLSVSFGWMFLNSTIIAVLAVMGT
jgi:multiple sugar transport system permease protein